MNSALPLLLLSQESKTWPKHKRHVSEPKYVKSGQDPLVSQFRVDCLTVFWRLLGVKLPEYPRRNMFSLRRSIGDENYLCLVRVNHPCLIMPFLLSFVPLERIHINRHLLQIYKSKRHIPRAMLSVVSPLVWVFVFDFRTVLHQYIHEFPEILF